MFPVSIVVATVAMASGVEGSTIFAPLFIIGLGLPPEVAIGTGLITETFGFASGVYAYVRRRLIDYRLAGILLAVTIPMGILGSAMAGYVDGEVLKLILGGGLILLALSFLRAPGAETIVELDASIERDARRGAESTLVTAEGEEIRYTVCNRVEGGIISGIGAIFMGMISTGLGQFNGYFLLQRCRMPSRVAVATSVLVVAFTALAAASGHFVQFVRAGSDTIDTVLSLVLFTVPGVIVGGQLGAAVGSRLPQHTLERAMGILFALVGTLMLWQALG